MEGNGDYYCLAHVLSSLVHLDPFRAMNSGELGFLWIKEILNSRYEERWREMMASEVVRILGRHFFRNGPASFIDVQPAWIPPLLGFLSLSEKLGDIKFSESSGFIALRILVASSLFLGFYPAILPVLTSSLLPTHPLQARHLASNLFLALISGWFSSIMESIPSEDLNKLVQAVDDPFHFPDLPLQDGKPVSPPHYDPTFATAVLIGFALSDLWRNHLRPSNFTTFEEVVSTRDGKSTALGYMLGMTTLFPEFLWTGSRIAMAIRRLEELQCSNTAEVVIMWAWTVGIVDPVDHDGWRLIGDDTLRFYQTHGMERLDTLKRHIVDTTMDNNRFIHLLSESRGCSWLRVENLPQLPLRELESVMLSKYCAYLYLSRPCQLRRLYRLFGHDSVTWEEAVKAVGVNKEMYLPPGRSVMHIPSVDWACDYP